MTEKDKKILALVEMLQKDMQNKQPINKHAREMLAGLIGKTGK